MVRHDFCLFSHDARIAFGLVFKAIEAFCMCKSFDESRKWSGQV
jgi:hypothetical protein